MSQVVDATRTFFDQLAAVGWTMLAIGLGFHLARLWCRALAWRNILAAAYPRVEIKRLPIFGAYVAGVGLNSVAPARAGDVLKLVLVHTRIEGSTYATLTPTLKLISRVFATGSLRNTYTIRPCCVPTPPGVNGSSVDRLCTASTRAMV